jgi:hypothetical protein
MQPKPLLLLLLALLLAAHPTAQKLPPRDGTNHNAAANTGTIRGRIIAADTRKPTFRASVSLSWVPTSSGRSTPVSSRQAVTNMAGWFEFTNVPAGSYRLLALPGPLSPQYVRIGYGAERPIGDRSESIEVVAGRTTEGITIALPRGAVISGMVTDDFAEPLTRVEIVPVWFAGPGSRGQRFNTPVMTDDLGRYRLYGLLPGEYLVLATAANRDPVDGDAEELPGFVSTYYPGTADYATAQRVRVTDAREVSGIDFRLARGRKYSISGNVTDSGGRPLVGAEGQLVPRLTASFSGPVNRFTTTDDGAFAIARVEPGQYYVAVRESHERRTVAADGVPSDREVTTVPVDVTTADVEGLTIATKPGVTITGQVVFEPPGPKTLPANLRVIAEGFDTNAFVWPAPAALVGLDLSFTMRSLMSECMLRIVLQGWFVKSVTLDGRDISDDRRQFKPGERVTILLSSSGSTVEGTVSVPDGKPAVGSAVIMFAQDRAGWTTTSVRLRRAQVESNGRFKITDLPPGAYYIVAGARERVYQPGAIAPSYFEALTGDASTIVMGDRERRSVALKMSR